MLDGPAQALAMQKNNPTNPIFNDFISIVFPLITTGNKERSSQKSFPLDDGKRQSANQKFNQIELRGRGTLCRGVRMLPSIRIVFLKQHTRCGVLILVIASS